MIIRAKAFWAKLQKPAVNYNKDGFEWTVDLSVDDKTKAAMINDGFPKSAFKNKDDDRGWFITFRRKTVKADGTDAKPIDVVGRDKQPFTKLIGNGTVVNAKVFCEERSTPDGKKYFHKAITGIQIWEHVEYESKNEEFPTDESGNEAWD